MQSTAVEHLTESEKYSLWCEHVRLLFTPPVASATESSSFSPFERRYPPELVKFAGSSQGDLSTGQQSHVTPLSRPSPRTPPAETLDAHTSFFAPSGQVPSVIPTPTSSNNNTKRRNVPLGHTATHDVDEERFPFCFYARMLQRVGGAPHPLCTSSLSAAADADVTVGNETLDTTTTTTSVPPHPLPLGRQDHSLGLLLPTGADDSAVFSSVSQHLYMDEDALVRRLTSKLQQRAARARRQAEDEQRREAGEEVYYGDGYGASFSDPRVEALQAALTAELTEVVCTVREQNALATALRVQLERSRAVRCMLPPSPPLDTSSDAR